MADESERNSEDDQEDPSSEAERFSALLSVLHEHVPELEAWRLEGLYGDEFDSPVFVLYDAWSLVSRRLFDEEDRPIDVDGVWPRLLAVIEPALELCDLLFEDGRDDDGLVVDVFAGSGIMCDVTRNIASLQALLPLMGPVTLNSARVEISNHTTSRGYDEGDVDWSASGQSYRPLLVSPTTLVPARRG